MTLLTDRYADKIQGVLSCYDRMVIQGTLQGFHYPEAMSWFLRTRNIRIFDYPQFAKSLKEDIRLNVERIAQEQGIEIEFIAKSHIRKENIIQNMLDKRGRHPGLVAILSAMEQCPAYRPWHDQKTNTNYLRHSQSQCLHYYFYFIDEDLGLCYLRVPTWAPFRLQFYFNAHNWLASALKKNNIPCTLADNALTSINDFPQAQQIADSLRIGHLHKKLDAYAKQFCCVVEKFSLSYHWSITRTEYATDILFKHQHDLQAIYDDLVRTAVHTVKPDHIATFLGRKLHGLYADGLGNDFNTRIEGTRIKHHMGPAAIKMYDQFKLILRIETTVNDPSFFKRYRSVEQRDGQTIRKYAPMRKNIYGLFDLKNLLKSANARYLEFISTIEDHNVGANNLNKLSKGVVEQGRPYKGFNFFDQHDDTILKTIARGEFNISGFQNKNLKPFLSDKNTGQISRILKRLRSHGLIKKIAATYKYYLTHLGRIVIATGLKLKKLFIIPQLCT